MDELVFQAVVRWDFPDDLNQEAKGYASSEHPTLDEAQRWAERTAAGKADAYAKVYEMVRYEDGELAELDRDPPRLGR